MYVDERRVQSYNTHVRTDEATGPVVYVMAREQRVHDNWALLYAVERAAARNVAMIVLFTVGPMFNNGSARHNEWMIASLQEVADTCAELGIACAVQCGDWVETVLNFADTYTVSELVFDFNPLQPVRAWREAVIEKTSLPVAIVDARNIIPCWQVSDKAEFAAHTFRPKVHRQLPEFLTAYPPLPKLPAHTISLPDIDWEDVRAFRDCDYSEPIPDTFVPGSRAALKQLDVFIETTLTGYAKDRNDPTKEAVSNLSPYLRWGNLSAQTVARAVKQANAPKEDTDAFLEELIVRRELTDNYVYYTKEYDTVAGAHAWAQKTLREHWDDAREYVYTYDEFAAAKTHDALWNAMQNQMVQEGKMHGWCRMYWAKKILEWTASPEEAIRIALTLNDRYELDGRDSNGVVGVMWSICGVHDRAWTERPVYGKIRYMNFNGAKRKFPVSEYIARYNPDTSPLI